MTRTRTRLPGTLTACLFAALTALPVQAEDLTMWVRESAADPGKLMIDLWNAGHDNKITLTAIPDNQMVTKLATSAQAGDSPDLVSFDLIYMPDFMKAGLPTDLTGQLTADPELCHPRPGLQGHRDLRGQDLWRGLHAGRVGAGLEQGPLQGGGA